MPSVHRNLLERLRSEFGIAAINLDVDLRPDPRYERQFPTYRRGAAHSPIVASILQIILTSLEESTDDGRSAAIG